MAKKISELTAITTIADNDLTPIVDTSETETKKMTALQMKNYAQGDLNTRLTTVETNGVIGATQYGGTLVTNFNTINKNGFYTGLGTATGVPDTNYSWFVTHQNSNTGTVSATQKAVAFSTSLIIYERTKISGTWGAWINTTNTSNQALLAYPVGSIYMNINSTSPATLFGGTWVQLKDRFLLGAGETYTNGATGGEATHKLTVNEMPRHSHELYGYNAGGSGAGSPALSGNDANWGKTDALDNAGGDAVHNNMPPYLVVYMWKRTA